MYSYFAKTNKNSNAVSSKYLHVNNFGYNEDIEKMSVCREHGRVDFQLIYVKSGSLFVNEDDRLIVVSAGDVCLFRPYEVQKYFVSEGKSTFFWVHFSGTEAEEMLSFFKNRVYSVGAFPEFEKYCHMFVGTLESERKIFDLLCIGGLITLVAQLQERLCFSDRISNDSVRIRPALEIMNLECDVWRSNDELARLCGFSKDHFVKIFKGALGSSPHQYYKKLTMDKSVFLLKNTTCNISEIADMCGFDDAFYFSRVFKKYFGVSPSEYRKTLR